MNNKVFYPSMLKIARQASGKTQSELCKELGKSQGTISRYEDRLIEPNAEDLEKIAQLLDVSTDFFYKEFMLSNLPYLRAKASASKKTLEKTKSQAEIFRVAFNRLMEEADIENHIPKLQKEFELCSPEECADKLRIFLGLANEPIINLTKIVESLGVFIYLYKFDTNAIDGFTHIRQGEYPIIFINSDISIGERVRFTLAHELGHLLLHRFKNHDDESIEKEAHRFASAFLMPKKAVQNYVNIPARDLYRSLFIIKKTWKVSIQALLMRFKELEYIDTNTNTNINIRISKDGYRTKEPNSIKVEQPENIKILFDIFKENGYSIEEMTKILLIDKNYLYKFFNEGKPMFYLIDKNKKKVINIPKES